MRAAAGLLGLAWACAAASAAMGLDRVAEVWLAAPVKTHSLATVLCGNASAHEAAVRELLAAYPPRVPLLVTLEPHPTLDLLAQVMGALRDHCGNGKCPQMTILMRDSQRADSWEVEHMRQTLFNTEVCHSGERGGIKVNCSGVWFVLSADFGFRALQESLVEDAEQPPGFSDDDLLGHCRTAARQRWKNTSFPPASLVHFIRGKAPPSAFPPPPLRAPAPPPPPPLTPEFFRAMGYIGQEHVVEAVVSALQAEARGLKMSSVPLVFVLLGPAGAGKTLLARLLASARNDGRAWREVQAEGALAIFSMVSYKNEEDVDSFVSPRQGLKGEGAMLRVFERSSRPVVVLDEVEKAHSKLTSEMLLPWLDQDGFVQDKKDPAVQHSTAGAVFVLTSNCFHEPIAQALNRVRQNKLDLRTAYEQVRDQWFANESALCNGRVNPFARPELQRRLRAGHMYASHQGIGLGSFGFLLFEEPRREQREALVDAVLLQMDSAYARQGGSLQVSAHARQLLLELAAQRDKGGFAVAESTVQSKVTEAVSASEFACRVDDGAHVFISASRGALQARVQCNFAGKTEEIASSGPVNAEDVSIVLAEPKVVADDALANQDCAEEQKKQKPEVDEDIAESANAEELRKDDKFALLRLWSNLSPNLQMFFSLVLALAFGFFFSFWIQLALNLLRSMVLAAIVLILWKIWPYLAAVLPWLKDAIFLVGDLIQLLPPGVGWALFGLFVLQWLWTRWVQNGVHR